MKLFETITAVVILACSIASAGEVTPSRRASFATKPSASKAGAQVKISFAVSAPTDVNVAVLDAEGKVVRHLAAGLLGENAPAPLKKDSLAQELAWDGKDDYGKAAAGGPFKARVRLGLGVELDRFMPNSGQRMPGGGSIGVGPGGEVFVLTNLAWAGGVHLYVLDRQGKYLRTILPSPANLKAEQVKGLGRLKRADGQEVPVIYEGTLAHFAPYVAGLQNQPLTVTKDGWIVFCSGIGDYTDMFPEPHVLVIKPDGTTPDAVGFVGPKIGETVLPDRLLHRLTVSPDGKTVYFLTKPPRMGRDRNIYQQAVFRTSWAGEKAEVFVGQPKESGSDGSHLKSPVGLTADAKGNVYVADAGNGRIAAFDSGGKFLGETKATGPWQVLVHPDTGAMYVLSASGKRGNNWAPFSVIKFDKAVGGKEVARFTGKGAYAVLALDSEADPPRLWLSYSPARNKSSIVPLTDKGGSFEVGENVFKPDPGLSAPVFLTLDEERSMLYVHDWVHNMVAVDLKTDKISRFLKASEVALDREGNVYALVGSRSNKLSRFSPDGKPLNFEGSDTNTLEIVYHDGTNRTSVRGLTVSSSGDIFAYYAPHHDFSPIHLKQFGPDGKLKNEGIIKDIPNDSACGVRMDREGNIYVGMNIKDPEALYPPEFNSQIPPLAWCTRFSETSKWYKHPLRGVPKESPWSNMFINPYLYHYGSVVKFPPEGGSFTPGGELLTAYFGQKIQLQGATWQYRGFGICSNRTETSGWGEASCSCPTSRFDLDASGRLFVPDVFRCSVGVLDANGNEIMRFGDYGNVDSAGPGSLIPGPKLPMAWPNAVAAGDDRVYIADRINRRIMALKLTSAAEAGCALP